MSLARLVVTAVRIEGRTKRSFVVLVVLSAGREGRNFLRHSS